MTYFVSPFNTLAGDRSRFLHDQPARHNVAERSWSPGIDINEDESVFQLVADVPGVNPKDINISLEGGVLTIRGKRKAEIIDADSNVAEGNIAHRERSHGSFVRQFNMPESAHAEGITAKSANGVLTVTIPKAEKAQPVTITVEVA